jgi:hypothetical protein
MLDTGTKGMTNLALIRQQFSRLDEDLAVHVVFSALALDLEKFHKTLALMSALMMERIQEREEEEEKLPEAEMQAMQELMAQGYLKRSKESQ